MHILLTYVKWYARLMVIGVVLFLLYISALCTRGLLGFLIWFDTISRVSTKKTTCANKWSEFDRFVENPDNQFVIQILLNICVDPIDMRDPKKRQPITNILYLQYCKANHLRIL